MSVNTLAAANALKTLLEGLSGLASVQIGAPASIGPQVTAWIGLGGQAQPRKTTGTTQAEIRYFVCFCYRIDANETTAETTLMGLVDAFTAALMADLTLAGTVRTLDVNSLAADEPDYQLRAGKEYREYPMVVTTRQTGAYTVNP